MVQGCWINIHRRGVLLIWMAVGQRPTALAINAGGGLCRLQLIVDFPCLSETTRYRPKYCPKGPLDTKQAIDQLAGVSICFVLSSKLFLRT